MTFDGPPSGVDPNVPSIARVYDYWLGGKDNFAADREMGERVKAVVPELPLMAYHNRLFLGRVVRFLAGEAGIGRFLDLGAGLPTMENVHEVAQKVRPDAEVVYVDNDAVALAHARALLATTGNTHVVDGDLYRPEPILAEADALIGLDRPVAVMMLAMLHFVPDEDAGRIVRTVLDAVPSGSYLVISHIGDSPQLRKAAEFYRASGTGVVLRSAEQIARFLDGLELVPPGVVPLPEWRPDGSVPALDLMAGMAAFCGVGRKP
ncbi:SAM-dependent methyltransferase [Nonomuraea sp. FMUSA5-5]|uniref:SAM-dependent methyltransferase n=1 Tax=Nonomuraea composti TaxID=2720023 RepID=A0ABX1BKR7_9ACTN|nr:SAM-dependent methyltransferase [Nonomuraea sp. FMUSA5-5]NJP97592.1 SAM-dependent methyltransferase [Nonomuraea sp. FMUSA5-5]